MPATYIGEALKALVMHEIGHTLGLRHNFRGSAGATAEQLADRSWTAEHGHGVSVMDYSPPALAADPRRQASFFSPTVGSYDRWAITYGYADAGPLPSGGEPRLAKGGGADADTWTPDLELNALRAIAGQAADPAHLYGSDEDAGFGGNGLDPTISRYDQTSDPLQWARERVQLIDWLLDSLDTRVVAPGQSYGRLRSAFTDLLTDRWYALLITTKYLGGATIARDHRGDPDGRPSYETIPAERERQALEFITEDGFGESAYRFRPELLSRLGPDRWMHWGASPGAGGRPDFPLHDWALAQEGSLLGQLLDPAVLARIRDAELRATPEQPTVGLPELFRRLSQSIWSELGQKGGPHPSPARNIVSVRRDLQRLHLNAMVRMVLDPAPGTPEDARSLARATLTDLGAGIDRALDARRDELDDYTRAHLADSRERITRALEAPMVEDR
jgi:Met-zincin